MLIYREMSGPWKLKKKSKEVPPPPNPTLVEVHEWVQPSHCHQQDNTLRHGQLLRWMDIAACLSAEKHSKMPCVTVSIDDITFETTVNMKSDKNRRDKPVKMTKVDVGHVVILKAVVNRAFTSSMEVGLVVRSEDPLTGSTKHVCKAYSVFVAKSSDGSKVKLPPVTATTEEENREYLLAAERRRMRVTYSKDIERVVKSLQFKDEQKPALIDHNRKVLVSDTQVHTIEIVLPVHANHHGTTFGGQIMEWMTDMATITALRLCRSQLILEGIESVHFRGPSYMGERISVQSSVNKVFSTRRFEVGVRVEGYAVGGESRHINSAFYTFRPKDEKTPLPELIPDTVIQKERAATAIARHFLWLDRRAIQYEERQVALNSENAYELILKNTSRLMTNVAITQWEVVASTPGYELFKHETSQNMVVRGRAPLDGLSAKEVFGKITDYSSRSKWDFMCKHCRSFRCITKDDDLIHLAMKAPEGKQAKPRDFVLLVSKRVPQDYSSAHRYYMVALSSVLCTEMPPLQDYERSQVFSSGYVMEDTCNEEGKQGSTLTYIIQIGSSVMPFLAKDIIGMSSLLQKLVLSLVKYLKSQ